MPCIYFTVTNDLSYDQRMIRICTSLATAGYEVHLIGRKRKTSLPLTLQPFTQYRLPCLFEKGKLFYTEYNLRLFFYLLSRKMDAICSIDLDTILPGLWISRIKKIPRIYDAHELFCEMKEVVTRPAIYRFWKWVERISVPHFKQGYTVNGPIADIFRKDYGVQYEVIRSIALRNDSGAGISKKPYILYQGAVNEGRSFETLIPAMKHVDLPLWICGDGNFMEQAKALVKAHGVEHKVLFKGMIPPSELRSITNEAYIGITLFEQTGQSNYYSLANRFFDYMQSGVPQLCVDYPVYRELNNSMEIAVLIDDLCPGSITAALNRLIQDKARWQMLHENCLKAAAILNWENEEKKLIQFYKHIFG